MDLLQIIKLVAIPKWVKLLSLAIISVFVALAIYAILGGAHLAEGSILQAGMGLLGVLLPLSIAILFLAFYEAGVAPLKKATTSVLAQLIPDVLGRIENAATLNSVSEQIIQEHSYRYRLIFSNQRALNMEVQLNVKKVCVVFYFAVQSVEMADFDFELVEAKLKHTLAGARLEGYTSNAVIGQQVIEGKDYRSLVMYKALPQDFLWNSAEKLYFAQDLQVMAASLRQEAGDWLALEG